jgi:hypothetical protein
MFVDLADILKTSKQFSNPSKRSNVVFEILALNVVLVFLRFLLRYYGSCYRLQHVEKKTKKRHVKELTCQTVRTCRKEKKGERRQKKRKCIRWLVNWYYFRYFMVYAWFSYFLLRRL